MLDGWVARSKTRPMTHVPIPSRLDIDTVAPTFSRALAHLDSATTAELDAAGIEADLRELVRIRASQLNGCAYCLSAHTYVAGRVLGLANDEIVSAREGESADPRIRALLRLSSAINRHRGTGAEDDVEAARAAGVSDAEMVEVIGHVAANAFSNYLAKAASVDIDFPPVSPRGRAA